MKKKTEFISRGVIPTPTSPNIKDKLKRSIFKVKDPEKFDRALKAM